MDLDTSPVIGATCSACVMGRRGLDEQERPYWRIRTLGSRRRETLATGRWTREQTVAEVARLDAKAA